MPWLKIHHGFLLRVIIRERGFIMSKKKDVAIKNFEGFEFGNEGNPTEFIPTGHTELDYIVSRGLMSDEQDEGAPFVGGLPTGKCIMIYGGEGGGKSSLAYRICGSAQRLGKIPIWIDVENSFSETLARINGVDLSRFGRKSMYDKENPEKVFDGEYALDAVMQACKQGAGVVVLDSIGSLVPRYVMENPSDKDTMAALARLLGKTVNKIASFAAANNTLVVYINQMRITPGAMFKDPESYPGGKAIAHACSVILKLNKITAKDSYTYIEDDEGNNKMIAGSANVFIQKNRFATPHFSGIRIPIYYEEYFPQIEEIVFQVGRQIKVISVRNNVYSWGKLKVEGRKEFINEMVSKNMIGDIVNDIKNAAQNTEKFILPPEIINYKKHVAYGEKNKEKLEKGKKNQQKAEAIDDLIEKESNKSSESVELAANPEL